MKKLILLAFCVFLLLRTLQAQKLPPFWQDITAFKKQDSFQLPQQQGIVFVGSSSFTKWKDINTYFPEYSIINRGFGGATLVDVIRYTYNIILPYQPKQVVIYCGENDLAAQDSITATEVLNRVKTLYAIIRTNLPNANISYVSIKPSPVRASIQGKVLAANMLIKAFLKKQKNTAFIDVYKPMLDSNGQMREELYAADRLHMKPEGYTIWQKMITPYLVK